MENIQICSYVLGLYFDSITVCYYVLHLPLLLTVFSVSSFSSAILAKNI